jgi:hypothetical protein
MCSAKRELVASVFQKTTCAVENQTDSTVAQMRAADRPPDTATTELPTRLLRARRAFPAISRCSARESALLEQRPANTGPVVTLAVGLQARPSALEFLEADCVWSNVSSRIYGQQADPVIGYCPALTRLPRTLALGVRA